MSAAEALGLLLERVGVDKGLADWIQSAYDDGEVDDVSALLSDAAPSAEVVKTILEALRTKNFVWEAVLPHESQEHSDANKPLLPLSCPAQQPEYAPSTSYSAAPREGLELQPPSHSKDTASETEEEEKQQEEVEEDFLSIRAGAVRSEQSEPHQEEIEEDMVMVERAERELREARDEGEYESNMHLVQAHSLTPTMRFLCDLSAADRATLAAQDDETLGSLLALLAAEEQAPPCRHFLAGGCYRSDCWFNHDLSSIPCRFFLAGFCKDGEECLFMHARAPPAVCDAIKWLRTGHTLHQPTPSHGNSILSSDLTQFPALSISSISSMHTQHKPTSLDTFARVAAAPACSVPPHSPLDIVSSTPHVARFSAADYPGLWVNAGSEVSAQYQRLRAAAIERAVARNRFFGQARSAYGAADMKTAKNLAMRARALDEEMRQLHQSAAAAILASRNASGNPHDVLDLHGLHVSEALAFLDTWLHEAKRVGRREVFVVAGAGRHSHHRHLSEAHQVRLFPAVFAFLQEHGYRVRVGSGNLHGTIHVQL